MMTPTMERLAIKPMEAFELIGVSRSKGYEMMAAGQIPTITVGGVKRVPVEALRQLIAGQTSGNEAA